MKIDPLFKECLENVDPEVRSEVRLNMDIANRIHDLLKEKNMTQREFATMMGKRESEISRWLTGSHGFTTTTLAKISAVLNDPIVEVTRRQEAKDVTRKDAGRRKSGFSTAGILQSGSSGYRQQ